MATKFRYDNQFGDELTDKHTFVGSVAITGSLTVTGDVIGIAFESASYSKTASVANSLSTTPPTASYAKTASYASTTPIGNSVSSSWASASVSASYGLTASYSATASYATSASYSTTASYSANTQLQYDVKRQGFLYYDNTETTIAFDGAATFSIAPVGTNWTYYRQGVRNVISGSRSIPLSSSAPAQSGSYYIFMDDDSGTLQASTAAWTLLDSKVPVAKVFWDNTRSPKWWLANERHTVLLDSRVQYIEHSAGVVYHSGGTPSSYLIATDANVSKSFAISATVISDQDIILTLDALPKPTGTSTDYVTYYRKNATIWTWATSSMPFVYNTLGTNWIEYDNNGSMIAGVNNRWYNSYLLYTNISGSARYVVIPGRNVFTSLINAQAEVPTTFDFTGFEIDEAIIAYQLTWAAATGNASAGHVTLAAVPKRIQISTVSTIGTGAGTDHNTLANLQGGTVGEYYHLNTTEYSTLGVSASYASASTSASYANTSSYSVTATNVAGGTVSASAAFITGDLTTTTLHTQYITSSVEQVTGSTQFGSTTANTHQFTGSVGISGSLMLNGSTIIPSSSYSETSSYSDTTRGIVVDSLGNLTITRYSTGTAGTNFIAQRANGTLTAPTQCLLGDVAFKFQARPYYSGSTAGWPSSARGALTFYAAENQTDTNQGVYITFDTTP